MNARTLRRLAADHQNLRTQALPPNYLFSNGSSSDDLTSLDILLAGPAHTPFAAGVWKLHLSIPVTYPQNPPAAHFRTPIFHPNVDPSSGAVCVETLKRDWDARLTLRDVLVTISCLLIQPNPDSALNAEAGALLQEDFEAFAQRAKMFAGIQAQVPRALASAVNEAQGRGEMDGNDIGEETDPQRHDSELEAGDAAPIRRRRTIARVRSKMKRDEGSPSARILGTRRAGEEAGQRQPFVLQTIEDDVFAVGEKTESAELAKTLEDEENSTTDADQENDASRSPAKASTPKMALTPRRPHGAPVPLGELIFEEDDEDDQNTSENMELEYPPSPRKSPSKSRTKPQLPDVDSSGTRRPESSRNAVLRAPDITPPNDIDRPLAERSPFKLSPEASPSPRKARNDRFQTPLQNNQGVSRNLFGRAVSQDNAVGGIFKARSPSSAERKREEEQRRTALNAKLWELCGRDIKRWNAGDFDGEPFKMKAARW